jgi:hypothetical protein
MQINFETLFEKVEPKPHHLTVIGGDRDFFAGILLDLIADAKANGVTGYALIEGAFLHRDFRRTEPVSGDPLTADRDAEQQAAYIAENPADGFSDPVTEEQSEARLIDSEIEGEAAGEDGEDDSQ